LRPHHPAAPATALGALLRGDVRNVARDPLLFLCLALPLANGLLLRWGFPWLADRFDLWSHAGFAVGFTLVQCPLLVGVVAGFMLLDERDEGVLAAISVTPLGRTRFLAYRVTLPAIACIPLILLSVEIADLGSPPRLLLVAAALLAAAEAPMATLLLAAFAHNKVEGLALAKAAGLAVIAPLAALVAPTPWQWAAGVVPLYWPAKLFTLSDALAAGSLGYAGAGIVVHALWIAFLLSAFRRTVEN
jgi:fluoroquinolone transport system permease protein